MGGRFTGKVILVTGAASGIGRRTAERLIAEGAVVHGADIAPIASDALSGSRLDVTNETEWEALIASVTHRHSRLDGLVNAAGVIRMGSITETTLADFQRVMAVNVDGTFLGCKHAMRVMQRQGFGSIVNLSSTAGICGSPGAVAYTASKGAVRLLTKTVALEAIALPSRIRVNSVHPALTDTPMADAIVEQLGGSSDTRRALSELMPSGRLADPDEIASAILFLLSDESSYMNGSELVVDNGFTAQ